MTLHIYSQGIISIINQHCDFLYLWNDYRSIQDISFKVKLILYSHPTLQGWKNVQTVTMPVMMVAQTVQLLPGSK